MTRTRGPGVQGAPHWARAQSDPAAGSAVEWLSSFGGAASPASCGRARRRAGGAVAQWCEGRGRRAERRAARVHRSCCWDSAPSEPSRPSWRRPSEPSGPWLRRPTPGRSSSTAAVVRPLRPEPRLHAPADGAVGPAPSQNSGCVAGRWGVITDGDGSKQWARKTSDGHAEAPGKPWTYFSRSHQSSFVDSLS